MAWDANAWNQERKTLSLFCAQCNASFTAKRKDAAFCSPRCRKANGRTHPVRMRLPNADEVWAIYCSLIERRDAATINAFHDALLDGGAPQWAVCVAAGLIADWYEASGGFNRGLACIGNAAHHAIGRLCGH